MKFLLIILLFLLTFSGCAQKSAFERFQLTKSQELAEDSIQSSKIVNGKNEVVGVVTAVYLNKVNPKRYKNNEYFYVYLYAKNKNAVIDFTLNQKPALLQEALPNINEFTALTAFTSKWNKYYLIGFAEEKEQNVLQLNINIDASHTTLTFKKDQ